MFVHKQSSKMFYGFGVCSSLYAINYVSNQLNHPIRVGLHPYLLSRLSKLWTNFEKNYDNSHTDLPKAFDLYYYKYDTCFIY